MRITDLTVQQGNSNRVNVFVDGKYRFSLDVSQVVSLGVKIGRDYTDQEMMELEQEGQFGKLYARALEYCLMRPHSAQEVRQYLWRKTRDTHYKSKSDGKIRIRAGVSPELASRVFDKLVNKKYVDDEAFARYWVENRKITQGVSQRKLRAELLSKGVDGKIIDTQLIGRGRSDKDEIRKIIAKKSYRYPDSNRLMQYLARQGFEYDDIRGAMSDDI